VQSVDAATARLKELDLINSGWFMSQPMHEYLGMREPVETYSGYSRDISQSVFIGEAETRSSAVSDRVAGSRSGQGRIGMPPSLDAGDRSTRGSCWQAYPWEVSHRSSQRWIRPFSPIDSPRNREMEPRHVPDLPE